MNSVRTVLTLLGGAVAVLSVVTAFFLLLKGSYAQQRIKQLRTELDDERDTTVSLRARNTDLTSSLDRCEEESQVMKAENTMLRAAPKIALDQIAQMIREDSKTWVTKMDEWMKTVDTLGERVDEHASRIIAEVRRSRG